VNSGSVTVSSGQLQPKHKLDLKEFSDPPPPIFWVCVGVLLQIKREKSSTTNKGMKMRKLSPPERGGAAKEWGRNGKGGIHHDNTA
jgi:hypothetical protein